MEGGSQTSGGGSDSDRFGLVEEMRASQAYQVAFKEALSLRAKAVRLIERQVNDLKTMNAISEQNELLEHLDLSIWIATCLSRYASACISNPFTVNDPEFRRVLIDASLLLSQHEDKGVGK
jgi:hypothetical protein